MPPPIALQAETIHVLAERVQAVGGIPDGRASAVAKEADLPEFPNGLVDGRRSLALLRDSHQTVIARVGSRVDVLGAVAPSSQDSLIALSMLLQKQAWMLRAHLTEAGGT